MKKNRQEKLLELISRYEIDTQDELIERLREYGFDVTQATVSRDIRELKIVKMATGRGTYRYAIPNRMPASSSIRFSSALVESVLSVDHAGNLLVMKTLPGLANAVAAGIDGLNLSQILGCVAGDDTILVVIRDADDATDLAMRVHDLMKKA